MKRYAAYTSGKGTRIRKAILKYPELGEAIKCVITDEAFNKELADFYNNYQIDYYSLDFKALDKTKDRNLVFSDFLHDKLMLHKIDYCFSFGGHILKGDLLKSYHLRLVNFHPGLLPDIIGLHAIDKAIEAKKRYIGNTVHFIDSGIDSGPIIMQNIMLSENFYVNGYDVILDEQVVLLWNTFNLIERDEILIVDNKVVITGADYTTSNIYPRLR